MFVFALLRPVQRDYEGLQQSNAFEKGGQCLNFGFFLGCMGSVFHDFYVAHRQG